MASYYFFECMDGHIGNRYMTLGELGEIQGAPMDEQGAIRLARDMEAALYRTDREGASLLEGECLHDPNARGEA